MDAPGEVDMGRACPVPRPALGSVFCGGGGLLRGDRAPCASPWQHCLQRLPAGAGPPTPGGCGVQPGSWNLLGLKLVGKGAGSPSNRPSLALASWLSSHWLVGEEPFVFRDKEEIEKFLRPEEGLALVTVVTACSSTQPLTVGASLPLRRIGLGARWGVQRTHLPGARPHCWGRGLQGSLPSHPVLIRRWFLGSGHPALPDSFIPVLARPSCAGGWGTGRGAHNPKMHTVGPLAVRLFLLAQPYLLAHSLEVNVTEGM